jgi:hypothetical protein
LRAADAHRSTFGVPASRACSTPATYERERTYVHRDRASHLEARSRSGVRGCLEGRPEAPRACPPQRPCAPAPCGALIGLLPSPNHFRIFADKLRVICIATSLPPPSGAVASEVKGEKRGSGDDNGSRSPNAAPAREHSGSRHAREALVPVSEDPPTVGSIAARPPQRSPASRTCHSPTRPGGDQNFATSTRPTSASSRSDGYARSSILINPTEMIVR